jgi:hypothetical protein
MSPSGDVITRFVKPVPAAWNVAMVMPAPKMRSFALVVCADPLFAALLFPDADDPASNGLAAASPPYSRARMSTAGTAALKFTLTTLFPALAAFMFAA